MLTKLIVLLLTLSSSGLGQQREPPTVKIRIFSLFRPRTLDLTTSRPVLLRLDSSSYTLDAGHAATLRVMSSGFAVELGELSGFAQRYTTSTLILPTTTFTLSVPGKLRRSYQGSLTVTSRKNVLIAVVTMDTETAVASIVAAESAPTSSLESLKAQAIASRSYLLANSGTHHDFDACDTTHCQFLRSPPPTDSAAAKSTQATHHLVLTWRSPGSSRVQIVPAMYSRSCGGFTHDRSTGMNAYPFHKVRCEFCLRHPEVWSRAATFAPRNEEERLAFNRIHGWSAVPSTHYTASEPALEGVGTGHGVGLCQLGADDMARRGCTFWTILSHYYPNTSLTLLP